MVTGTDDMGPFVDTGVSVTPAQRPSTVVDVHTLIPTLVEHDTGTGTAVKLPPAARSATQRR